MLSELVVAVLVVAFDCGVLGGPVHPLDLPLFRHDVLGVLTFLLLHGGAVQW